MKKNIIKTLAGNFEKDEAEIISAIEHTSKFSPYTTKIINNKKVIEKKNVQIKEQIVLDYYKLIINKYCNIKFPNRSYIMSELMNILPYLHKYHAYSIFKFDFKDFFYNVSATRSFEYIIKSTNLNTKEYMFLKTYTDDISELIPGIGLHNSLIEVIGNQFDIEVKKVFKDNCIYYARYVDDCILILDEKVEEEGIKKKILELMANCFGKKVKLNEKKTDYFHSDCVNYEINYLGYVFQKGQSAKKQFKFGISKNKLAKFYDLLDEIIIEYKNSNNLTVLSFKLELLFKRIVFYGTRRNNLYSRWQVRGLSDSYKELKRFMKNNDDYSNITNDTKNFFLYSIINSFGNNNVKIPAKISNQIENKKFVSCFLNNKTLLLHNKIGLDYQILKSNLSSIYNGNLENYTYNELAKKLLSKIK